MSEAQRRRHAVNEPVLAELTKSVAGSRNGRKAGNQDERVSASSRFPGFLASLDKPYRILICRSNDQLQRQQRQKLK
jgi:hypothetical protein